MEENRLYEQPPGEGFSLCMWVRQRLPDYQEGILDAMTVEAIRAHLSVCYLCMKEYQELEQTVKLVETLPFVDPHRNFAPAIMAALKAQPEYSFQTPVVEVEASETRVTSQPQSTTRHTERQTEHVTAGVRSTISQITPLDSRLTTLDSTPPPTLKERAWMAFALVALMLGMAASGWGRAVLGPFGYGSRMVGQMVDALGTLPIVGDIGRFGYLLAHQAASGMAWMRGGLESATVPAVLAYSGLFALGWYAWSMRLARRVSAS